MRNEDIGRTLLAIYDTATSPEHWPQALDAFSRGIYSAGAILVAVDNVGLPFNIQQATSNFGLGAVQYYFENFGRYDEPEMCVVLRSGAVIVANREARRIHDMNDGLSMFDCGHVARPDR